MSRSANTLSALNSAPGSLFSVKTTDVLSGVPSGTRCAADREEARDVVVVVLDAGCGAPRGRTACRRARTRSPPYRGAARRAPSWRCPRCRRWRSPRRASASAGSRAHCASACGCDSTRRTSSSRTPGSASRLWTTGTCTSPTIDRSRFDEQVVVAVNRPADRVLDRHDAERSTEPSCTASNTSSNVGYGRGSASGSSRKTAASLNAPGSP